MTAFHRFSSVAMVGLAIVLAAVMTGPLVGNPQSSNARTGSVAVLDLSRAFTDLRERTQIDQETQAIVAAVNEERNNRARAIEQIVQNMQILAPDSEEFARLRAERQQKETELRLWAQFQERRLTREALLRRESLYRKVIATAGEMASQAGYDVVLLRDPETAFPPNINPQQFEALAANRKLLWSRPEVDLTRSVVERMNANFGR